MKNKVKLCRVTAIKTSHRRRQASFGHFTMFGFFACTWFTSAFVFTFCTMFILRLHIPSSSSHSAPFSFRHSSSHSAPCSFRLRLHIPSSHSASSPAKFHSDHPKMNHDMKLKNAPCRSWTLLHTMALCTCVLVTITYVWWLNPNQDALERVSLSLRLSFSR